MGRAAARRRDYDWLAHARLRNDWRTDKSAARPLALRFDPEIGTLQFIRVSMAQPVRDAKRLTRLLCDKIETVDLGFDIEIMKLVAIEAEPLREKQAISSLVEACEPDVSDLVDVLVNRVGSNRLYRLTPVQSDVPERSVARVPACRRKPRHLGRRLAAPTAGFWRGPSRSRPWRCCPTTRQSGSPDAVCAGA